MPRRKQIIPPTGVSLLYKKNTSGRYQPTNLYMNERSSYTFAHKKGLNHYDALRETFEAELTDYLNKLHDVGSREYEKAKEYEQLYVPISIRNIATQELVRLLLRRMADLTVRYADNRNREKL